MDAVLTGLDRVLMSKLHFFSYSRADRDDGCRRARYYASEFGGTGLTPLNQGFDLAYGNIIHKGLEQLATSGSINYAAFRKEAQDEASKTLHPSIARDYGAMAEGHLRGFERAVWPRWMSEYEIIETEKLRSWEVVPGYVFRFRQDILLKSKFDGLIVYPDYKTTSSNDAKWIASWAKSPQLHSSAHALQASVGIEVTNCIIQGLYKGYKDRKTGAPTSPFTYGWVNREFSMMPQYSYSYQRSRGWEKFATADEFEDLSSWVANMPAELLAEQFPQTGPIGPRTDIAESYFRQQLMRERQVGYALEELTTCETVEDATEVLDFHFKQTFSRCQPAYGFACEFADLCWTRHGADPLGSGLFVRRERTFEDGSDGN